MKPKVLHALATWATGTVKAGEALRRENLEGQLLLVVRQVLVRGADGSVLDQAVESETTRLDLPPERGPQQAPEAFARRVAGRLAARVMHYLQPAALVPAGLCETVRAG